MLQDYMADHDQQYLIEMDSNQSPGVLFKVTQLHQMYNIIYMHLIYQLKNFKKNFKNTPQ